MPEPQSAPPGQILSQMLQGKTVAKALMVAAEMGAADRPSRRS